MVGAAQRCLDIAENHVHLAKFQMLHGRPLTADHDLLVNTARDGDAMKAEASPSGEHAKAYTEVLLRPGGDFGGANSFDNRQLHARRMPLLAVLDGSTNCVSAGAPRSSLPLLRSPPK